MSAFNAATVLLFPGLGLVALAIGLLSRRYTATALGTGLAGLLSIATAATWIITIGPVTDVAQLDQLKAENTGQQNDIAKLQAQLDEARKRPTPLPPQAEPPEGASTTASTQQLRQELEGEQRERAEAEHRADDADQKCAAATARAAEFDGKVRMPENGRQEAQRRATCFDDNLNTLERRPTLPASVDLATIRRKLADGEPPYFATQEERELIPGQTGSWHVIRLLQAGNDWNFGDRQFVITDPAAIKASAVRLRDDVLIPLSAAGKQWRLFVRGTADPRPVVGPVDRKLSYLPLSSNGTYAREPTSTRVAIPVQNQELPTLRAEWLRQVVQAIFGDVPSPIEILENPPQPGQRRSAELVLFVEK